MAIVETAALSFLARSQKALSKVIPGGWYTLVSVVVIFVLMVTMSLAAFTVGYVDGALGGDAKKDGMCEPISDSVSGNLSPNADASQFGGDKQKRNAQGIIDAVAKRGMSEHAAVVALATAMQESTLRMYWNPKVPGSKELTDEPDAMGVDGYSVGLFQQQVNGNMFAWGTAEEAMNIEKSTFMFLDALKRVPGWESLPVTVAAQRVQGSAHPDKYAQWEDEARAMVASMKPNSKNYGSGDSGSGNGALKPTIRSNKDVFDPNATSSSGLTVPKDDVYSKDAKRVWSAAIQLWGDDLDSIGGYRSGADAADHGTGNAIDIMIPNYKSEGGKALGTKIANHYVDNYKGYGIKYVIWRNRIWFPPGVSNSGWNAYNGGGLYDPNNLNDTTLHNDHVHVSVLGDSGDGLVDGSTGGGDGGAAGCDVSGSGTIGKGVGSGKGDDYPFKSKPTWLQAGTGPAVWDPWGGFYRECVSFVYWRINQQMGADPLSDDAPFTKEKYPGLGNGADFGPALKNAGFKVDQNPKKGAIAWWVGNRGIATSSAGHVAIVMEVNNDGTVLIEQYNADPPHAYSTMTISAGEPSGYIHVADLD